MAAHSLRHAWRLTTCFAVPLHGFLGKRETVRGRIEEKTFHKGGSSPAVSNIAFERKENKRKEKREVFATQGIIPSSDPAKLSLALLNLGDAFLLL